MVPFRYVRASGELIDSIANAVLQGESVVILGHRYAGKTFLLQQIEAILNESPNSRVVRIPLFRSAGIWNRREAFNAFYSAIPADLRSRADVENNEADFYAPIDWICEWETRQVILLASNVDAMGHALAREFLQAMRARVVQKKLVIVFTGEVDLDDLVHGPGSEFNCATHYFIQGFDQKLFRDIVGGFATARSIRLASKDDLLENLWKDTNGDYGVTDAILGNIADDRVASMDWTYGETGSKELRAAASSLTQRGPVSTVLLHRASEIISWEPTCWNHLQTLLLGQNPVTIDTAPGPLEIAGIARRTDFTLEFSSPFMKQFCETYYTKQRFGDLNARNGNWENAFNCWKIAGVDRPMRPTDLDDRTETAALIRALCTSLHSYTSEGPDRIAQLFAEGCRYILGLQTVTFWSWTVTWSVRRDLGFPMLEEHGRSFTSYLPTSPACRGVIPLPQPLCLFAKAAALDTLPPDSARAVIVGDTQTHEPVSRERARLMDELLDQFVQAYSVSVIEERNRQRLAIRDKHLEVIDSIIDSLGSSALDVKQALDYAAKGLRPVGYRRVLFCLVDPKRERIFGVLDSSDENAVDIASMTNYSLADPNADIQPYVVKHGEPMVVQDATKEPLANREVVSRAGLRAFAVIPMKNQQNQVLGTIHIERADYGVPSKEEVDDLLLFGRPLAILIEQSERVGFLQSTLEKSPDPGIIVDSSERLRYVNREAARLFEIREGWVDQSGLLPFTKYGLTELEPCIRSALLGNRKLLTLDGLGADKNFRGTVTCDVIRDWNKQILGALVHVENQHFLYGVFEALTMVAKADSMPSALEAFLEAVKRLGHKWGRLYLIEDFNPDTLISRRSFGPDEELCRKFNSGDYPLPRSNSEQSGAWLCIDNQKPFVLEWVREEKRASQYVDLGLEVVQVAIALYANDFGKNEGEPWLELPVGKLGKIVLPLLPNFRSEQLRWLEVLSDNMAQLLQVFLERDRFAKERDQMILRSAADHALAMTTHNIATRLASLPVILGRYRLREMKPLPLRKVNDDFSRILQECQEFILRAKELLGTVQPRVSRFDLFAVVKKVLEDSIPPKRWTFTPKKGVFNVEADRGFLETCLLHFIENSRKAVGDDAKLQIDVFIERVSRSGNNCVRLVFSDHGPGIRPEYKIRIFDDFFSAPGPSQKRGLGLGLGFVRRVVEAHGGKVWEEGTFGDQPDHGARFIIQLPDVSLDNERGN